MITHVSLFEAGKEGYSRYHIPALAVTKEGTILAFCEARKGRGGDAVKTDILLRRSVDGGRSWSPAQLVAADGDDTCGNPCPVVDQSDGTIWLPFCKNPSLPNEHTEQIVLGKAPRTVWITKSTDDGATWSEPQEITGSVKLNSWTWYATGPTHGIQLTSGRLLIPCDHVEGITVGPKEWNLVVGRPDDLPRSHVIYSDDHGRTWQIGGSVDRVTSECGLVETVDGALYINCRNKGIGQRRAYAWSWDGGLSFSPLALDGTLVDPNCQANLVRMTSVGTHDRNRVLFSNPASLKRERLTVRLSYDECQTWAVSRVLHEGPSAYSDLCIAPDMAICCLYDRGTVDPYEEISFARFSLEWLTNGEDAWPD